MSQVVHILKFYADNQLFIERNRLRKENMCCLLLAMGKKHKDISTKIIKEYNERKGIAPGLTYCKGLTLPRLRILTALIAQKEGLKILPSLVNKLDFDNTPERFRTKFRELMTEGFWMVGTVIEDSLAGDPSVNCGNPFEFGIGDLAFWWAGVVIMDWLKYCNIVSNNTPIENALKIDNVKKYSTCVDFYADPCISRKHKYEQDSALSSLNRIPQQFLFGDDFDNFVQTISNITIKQSKVNVAMAQLLSKFDNLNV